MSHYSIIIKYITPKTHLEKKGSEWMDEKNLKSIVISMETTSCLLTQRIFRTGEEVIVHVGLTEYKTGMMIQDSR